MHKNIPSPGTWDSAGCMDVCRRGGEQDIDQTFNLSVGLLPCEELLCPGGNNIGILSIRHCKNLVK